MDPPPIDPEGEQNNFLETQFLFYLLPCYYGVVALLFRYFKVLETEPTYYVSHIPGEKLLKYCESEEQRQRNSQALTYRILPASFVIKAKLSLFNCYLYLSMVFLSFICTPNMFYSAGYIWYSFLYIFGSLAWYLSALVLRREQQRNMAQSIWIHRLFWILAGTFSVYKMFEDYFLPLNLIVNILLIMTNLILAIYGIYRAEDTDTLQMSTSEDIPSFVKIFFEFLQLNDRIRYWLGVEDMLNENLVEDGNATRPDIDNQDLVAIGHVLKRSAQSIKSQINLLNELPRRNVFVDKKVRYLREGDTMKSCYFILSQVGNSRFQALRTIEQFQALHAKLADIFTAQNFPKHVLPRPIGLLGGQVEGNMSENLQTWFEQILKTPIFITKELLVFLNVDSQKSAPFIAYFQNSYSSFCSRHYIMIRHNRKNISSVRQVRQTEFSGYFDPEVKIYEPSDHEKIIKLLDYEVKFFVTAESVIGEERSIMFGLSCLIDKSKRLSWDLKKTPIGLGILNQRIEEECNCSVPQFYSLVGGLTTKNKQKINQNCRRYLQLVLNSKKYYCTSLFTFIKYDIIKQEVILTDGGQLIFQAVERQSQILDQYDDKGGLIEVVRVERLKRGSVNEKFSFRFRRKDLYLTRTSNELLELRQQLASIYKGVSFIPEIRFKNNSKWEVKTMVEGFLLKIENLPRIEIIDEYHTFYGDYLHNDEKVKAVEVEEKEQRDSN